MTAIFVTCHILPEFEQELRKHFVPYLCGGKAPVLDATERASVRAFITSGSHGAPKELFDLFPNVEIVANLGIGVDAIDLDVARARGVVVTNTPDVVADDVADLAMGMMIERFRRMGDGDRYVRAGKWGQGPFPPTRSLSGKTLGIVGLGGIGQALARRAITFRMNVKWYGPRPKPDAPYRYVPDLEQLARESDVLVVACPGGRSTRHLINARVLAALGPEGVLINVARGSVVDTGALIAALRSRQIAGAALDVFEDQPQVPQELLALDNVLLSPHLGTSTRETRGAMSTIVLQSLVDHFAGRTPQNRVT
jgi:hydroxypyruvate reductase